MCNLKYIEILPLFTTFYHFVNNFNCDEILYLYVSDNQIFKCYVDLFEIKNLYLVISIFAFPSRNYFYYARKKTC